MPILEITVMHAAGLHARPAAKFVQTAAAFPCDITVSNLTNGGKPVNAKSILSVLTLGVSQGCQIRVEAGGDQADEAIEAIRTLIESNFGETST